MYECPEKSSFCLNVVLKDSNGAPLTPIDEVKWWVGKPREDDPIIEKTEVESPEADMDIVVPKEANICTSGRDEERFVIVMVRSGVHTVYKQFDYSVINYSLVPYEE